MLSRAQPPELLERFAAEFGVPCVLTMQGVGVLYLCRYEGVTAELRRRHLRVAAVSVAGFLRMDPHEDEEHAAAPPSVAAAHDAPPASEPAGPQDSAPPAAPPALMSASASDVVLSCFSRMAADAIDPPSPLTLESLTSALSERHQEILARPRPAGVGDEQGAAVLLRGPALRRLAPHLNPRELRDALLGTGLDLCVVDDVQVRAGGRAVSTAQRVPISYIIYIISYIIYHIIYHISYTARRSEFPHPVGLASPPEERPCAALRLHRASAAVPFICT